MEAVGLDPAIWVQSVCEGRQLPGEYTFCLRGELQCHTGVDSSHSNPGFRLDRGTAAYRSSGPPRTPFNEPPSPRTSADHGEPFRHDEHTWRTSGRRPRPRCSSPTPPPDARRRRHLSRTPPRLRDERASRRDIRGRLPNHRDRPLDPGHERRNRDINLQESRNGPKISQKRSFCQTSGESNRNTSTPQRTRRERPAESVRQTDDLGHKLACSSACRDVTNVGSHRNSERSKKSDEAWFAAMEQAVGLWRKRASCKDFSEPKDPKRRSDDSTHQAKPSS